jgi:hypothetical protein
MNLRAADGERLVRALSGKCSERCWKKAHSLGTMKSIFVHAPLNSEGSR